MGNDPSKYRPTTVYIPVEVWDEIVKYHGQEGNANFGDSKMVVSLLRKWYNIWIEEQRKRGAFSAIQGGSPVSSRLRKVPRDSS